VALGLVLGGAAAAALAGTVEALLFDIESTDVVTYAGVGVVLAVVALLACFMPARRAASVDPLIVLKGN
jgi:putative ABC transport system permease protein